MPRHDENAAYYVEDLLEYLPLQFIQLLVHVRLYQIPGHFGISALWNQDLEEAGRVNKKVLTFFEICVKLRLKFRKFLLYVVERAAKTLDFAVFFMTQFP